MAFEFICAGSLLFLLGFLLIVTATYLSDTGVGISTCSVIGAIGINLMAMPVVRLIIYFLTN
ncbi:hypothetical protein DTO96_102430 [Ephemeroptericola cinctiostellae]|uniref:Uncharacterized protein n=1 Tax=Ephemeroptericola cinctiostellae TaxID=2268024 RepID=A0A345DE87_9BURK|nr:hypothetical protein DTO96_102430 [Ephemeroptericola cinctiostellae]